MVRMFDDFSAGVSNIELEIGLRRIIVFMLMLVASLANASLPLEATLEEMAQSADHILTGRVVGVDMIDARGAKITDREARTGPGLTNTIRLKVSVDEVFVTNARPVPKLLAVPLDPFLHYTLGQIQDAHRGDNDVRLLLLKGTDFSGIKAGVFFRPISDKTKAIRIYKKSHR